ncbi:MAG TPA: histidine kinase [Bryobacteraceae bacterium]|nr:histidine kinase [Bryobacteraceae bacterium]
MPDWLSIHEPVLINTVGHAAGAVIFGILLYFLIAGRQRAWLPSIAAALAILWNVGSLVTLAAGPKEGNLADIAAGASFAVLSLLPAVLLHISIGRREKTISVMGYALSGAAVALHITDVITAAPRFHRAGLLLVIFGFSALTLISVIVEWRRRDGAAGSRLAAAMGLFLFAISFAHFEEAHAGQAWTRELAFHHAGIPLALFVLLQDYRFLLLDAFLRFIVNGLLAAAAVLLAIPVLRSSMIRGGLNDPFPAGLLFVACVILLAVFVWLRNRLDQFLTRVVFLRANPDVALARLQREAHSAEDSETYLESAARTIADFMRASRFELLRVSPAAREAVPGPVVESGEWARAILPLHLSAGDDYHLLLGPREGGRRYLSEDLAALARLGAAAVEEAEQLRSRKLQDLASQAELRALQAQINPHFLFNALNTLYGVIDRSNSAARQLVLNLSDVFRYLLRSERTIVAVEEELRIVRAYLAIEELRLGSRLRSWIEVDPDALNASIPLLSIQPLIENAVRHGVAARGEPGFVRLEIRRDGASLAVRVCNSGECDRSRLTDSCGIGLTNVRRRLELCYGAESLFEASVEDGVTTVGFVLPARSALLAK